jgi:hypothetical protein
LPDRMPLHDRERPLVAELSRSVAAAALAVPALNVLRLADWRIDCGTCARPSPTTRTSTSG